MSAASDKTLGFDLGDVVPVGRVVPVAAEAVPVSPADGSAGASGQVNVDWNEVGPKHTFPESGGSAMTESHPAFGGPKSAATPPRHTP